MLRGLDVRNSWRSLLPGFWPSDVPLGRRTVVYGHNGSGKSTVADLLLALATEGAPVETDWEDEERNRHRVKLGETGPAPSIAVFTRRWVEGNLSEFLDGKTASAIVTLGREAITAKEEEKRLEREIDDLRKSAKESGTKAKELGKRASKKVSEVQDLIVSELEDVDRRRFTRHRYRAPTVQADLARFTGKVPSSADHAAALMRLGEGVPERLAVIRSMPNDVAPRLVYLDELLKDTPTRQALSSLEDDPAAQQWVEEGIHLHEDRLDCLFCGSSLTPERRGALARHFDESWLEIRGRASQLERQVSAESVDLSAWSGEWPDPVLIAGDLRAAYERQLAVLREALTGRVETLSAVAAALKMKSQDPSVQPQVPSTEGLMHPPALAALQEAVAEHNQRADDHERVREEHIQTVLDYVIGEHSQAFRDLQKQADAATVASSADEQAAVLSERALRRLRAQKLTTNDTAMRLTEDLARVFGRGHLTVEVTADGKSYACWRGGEPATHLSDGERTTLSLLYFLRQLEDESRRTDPGQRIVVIDDPSSSLDREAVFATHQWLIRVLENTGQFILFTHDFNLLRLFLKSQKNQWDTSHKKITSNDADEKRFPRVAFVECFASNRSGQRQTRFGPLPDLLRKSTSEYAYLFSMVMKGIAEPGDHERLFLLPNAVRRVLEIFASYRTPDLPHFDRQLSAMVEEPGLERFRSVYDFCNRWSHGEGSESVDVLDARAVYESVRNCMAFMRAADEDHFTRLCKATGVDASVLD